MATVWKWPWDYIVKIQYWNVAGSLLVFLFLLYVLQKGFFKISILYGISDIGDRFSMVYLYFLSRHYSTDYLSAVISQGVGQGLFLLFFILLIAGMPEGMFPMQLQ
jgi:hypothetical protein